MVKEIYQPPIIEGKKFTLEEIDLAIKKLRRRVGEVNTLDPNKTAYDDAEVATIEHNIRDTIREVFGTFSPEFQEHQTYEIFHDGNHVMSGEDEVQHCFAEGIPQAVKMIEGLIKRLEEKKEDLPTSPVQSVAPVDNDLNLHPKIYSKCFDLHRKGHYAEAVEKSFKVVRDRLRTLTGHETGSKAFGSGKLHIKGAAAANVDVDFNEGVKFLTMAIDQFRNEKSHTSDAKIDDPVRANRYLQMSSLAMDLLEDAEILQTP